MQNIAVFIVFSVLTWMNFVGASGVSRDDAETLRGRLSSLTQDTSDKDAQCFLKQWPMQHPSERFRRASISRPYFHHWRAARENTRPALKNFMAFSPRLGRAMEEDETSKFADPTVFSLSLIGHLNDKQFDLVYEDATKICTIQVDNEKFLGKILEQVGVNGN